MDFTRQPIIETIITPKEGCKLVIRSSKTAGQEEYFVDAVEIVSFGQSLFFRSTEKPKSFLVPVSDYEVVEIKETRMVLKNVGVERTIKIGGGKESSNKEPNGKGIKEVEKQESSEKTEGSEEASESSKADRLERRRDKRRQSRRRRGREEVVNPSDETTEVKDGFSEDGNKEESKMEGAVPPASYSSLLAPPPTLISETIARYKDNALFKGAFYVKEPEGEGEAEDRNVPQDILEKAPSEDIIEEVLEMQNVSLEPSEFGFLDFSEEEEFKESSIENNKDNKEE